MHYSYFQDTSEAWVVAPGGRCVTRAEAEKRGERAREREGEEKRKQNRARRNRG